MFFLFKIIRTASSETTAEAIYGNIPLPFGVLPSLTIG
jgi:hypothetical protein